MKGAAGRLTAIAVLVVLLAVAAGYVVYAAHRGGSASTAPQDGPAPSAGSARDVDAVTSAGRYYLFKSSALDHDFGRLAVAAPATPSRRVLVDNLRCNRTAFAGGRGVCLQLTKGVGMALYIDVAVLDARLQVIGHLKLAGYPSRAKVAPDGQLAAATTFVAGDSYTSMGFSTRTSIMDLTTDRVLFDLESLSVTKDGRPFHASDFNFWGVTFEPDSRHFYATLGSGGQTYLIHGDVQTKGATVVTTGMECPSLSPDGTLIAFKKRVPGSTLAWHLWIRDVATGREHPTAETRYVDDQASWLDDRTVAYGLAVSASDGSGSAPGSYQPPAIAAGASIDTDMWVVRADGSGSPRRLIPHAWSAQLVG